MSRWSLDEPDPNPWARPETEERNCIKCDEPVPVPYDYIGRPWCPRCIEADKRRVAGLTEKRRSA